MPGDRKRARRGVLVLAMLAAGCVQKSTVEPTRAPVVVHAVLDAGTSDQLVVVEYARTGSTSPPLGIAGADVMLIGPDGVEMRGESEASADSGVVDDPPGYYRVALGQYGTSIVPGGSYTLRVRVPDGTEVTGTTTVPTSAPDTAYEVRTFNLNRDTLRLRWSKVSGARAYQVQIASPYSHYEVFADSTLMLDPSARTITNEVIFVPSPVDYTTVVVLAVDSNYYAYYRQQSDPFAGAAPSQLRGGDGVFGSVVPIITRRLQVTF